MSYILFFRETFRKERSFAYQAALRRATAEKAQKALKKAQKSLAGTTGAQSPVGEKAGYPAIEMGRMIPQEKLDEMPRLVEEKKRATTVQSDDVKLSYADVNILGAAWYVVQQKSNAATLLATGQSVSAWSGNLTHYLLTIPL